MRAWSTSEWRQVCPTCWLGDSLSTRLVDLKAKSMYSRLQEVLKENKKTINNTENLGWEYYYSAEWSRECCYWIRERGKREEGRGRELFCAIEE